jgi:hypothetical protein
MDIAVVLPGGDFVDESLFVGNAAVEALGGKDAKLGPLRKRRDKIPAGKVERGERKRTVDEVSKAD